MSQKICKFHPNCTNPSCQYLHTSKHDPKNQSTANNQKLCKFFQQGACTRQFCPFQHPDGQGQEQAPQISAPQQPAQTAAVQQIGIQGTSGTQQGEQQSATVINVASINDPAAIKALIDKQKQQIAQNTAKSKAGQTQKNNAKNTPQHNKALLQQANAAAIQKQVEEAKLQEQKKAAAAAALQAQQLQVQQAAALKAQQDAANQQKANQATESIQKSSFSLLLDNSKDSKLALIQIKKMDGYKSAGMYNQKIRIYFSSNEAMTNAKQNYPNSEVMLTDNTSNLPKKTDKQEEGKGTITQTVPDNSKEEAKSTPLVASTTNKQDMNPENAQKLPSQQANQPGVSGQNPEKNQSNNLQGASKTQIQSDQVQANQPVASNPQPSQLKPTPPNQPLSTSTSAVPQPAKQISGQKPNSQKKPDNKFVYQPSRATVLKKLAQLLNQNEHLSATKIMQKRSSSESDLTQSLGKRKVTSNADVKESATKLQKTNSMTSQASKIQKQKVDEEKEEGEISDKGSTPTPPPVNVVAPSTNTGLPSMQKQSNSKPQVVAGAASLPTSGQVAATPPGAPASNTTGSTTPAGVPGQVVVEQPGQTRRMTAADVNKLADDFMKQLDSVAQQYGVDQTLMEGCGVSHYPEVELLLSFDTKVNYLAKFFDSKLIELNNMQSHKSAE